MQQLPMEIECQRKQQSNEKNEELKEELIKCEKMSVDQQNDQSRKQIVLEKIFNQMMFYTSTVNLITDGYLRQTIQESKDGFLPINLFISFKYMDSIFQDYNNEISHQAKIRLFFQAIKNKRRFFAYDRSKKTVKILRKIDIQKAKKQFLYFQIESQTKKFKFQSVLKQISNEINSQLNKTKENTSQMTDEKSEKPKNRKQPLFQLKMGQNQPFGFLFSKYIQIFKVKMMKSKQFQIKLTLNYQQWSAKKKECRKISQKLLKKSH